MPDITDPADAIPKAGPRPANRASLCRRMAFCAGPAAATLTNAALLAKVPPDRRCTARPGSPAATTDRPGARAASANRVFAASIHLGHQIGWHLRSNTSAPRLSCTATPLPPNLVRPCVTPHPASLR